VSSLRISGGALSTTLYNDGRGEGRRCPVIEPQALFSSALTFYHDKSCPNQCSSIPLLSMKRPRLLFSGLLGLLYRFSFLASWLFLSRCHLAFHLLCVFCVRHRPIKEHGKVDWIVFERKI